LARPDVRRVLYGGAKGGGKSAFLCAWVFTYAWSVMAEHKLPVSSNPPHIGWMGRKQATDFTATTLQTWRQMIPEEYYELKGGTERDSKHILIMGRVAVDYGGLDRQESINKFNSAEYGCFAIDQAEETSRDDISVLRGSLRKTINGTPLPYKELYTANPRPGWLKEDFVDQQTPGSVFVPALPSDNPYLPDGYEDTLIDAFGYRPELIAAYLRGDWQGLSGVNQVILEEWIAAAKIRYDHAPYIKKWVSVDPARFGDDKCVILAGENTAIVDAKVLPYCPEPQIVTTAAAMAERMGDSEGHRVPIIVEVVGACGVSDYLIQDGRSVIEYCPSHAADNPDKYYNKRSEVWSTVARWMHDGVFDERVGALFVLPEPEDDSLRTVWQQVCRQITWPWYDFRGQKILIAAKKDIKAEHSGVSPDYADAYINGVAHLPMIRPIGAEQRRRERRLSRPAARHPMGM
jgi:hypothetical protein